MTPRSMASARFLRTLLAARDEVRGAGPATPAASATPVAVLYRRAVPTDARAGLAPPPLPVAGLRLASNGVAALVPEEFADGRLTADAVDAALHAARAAGATWIAAFDPSPQDAAVLRALAFVAFDDAPAL